MRQDSCASGLLDVPQPAGLTLRETETGHLHELHPDARHELPINRNRKCQHRLVLTFLIRRCFPRNVRFAGSAGRAAVPATPVSRNSDSSHNSRAGHPGWLRCSSLTYFRYARSSRLAIRAPRSGTYATNHCYGTLVGPIAPRPRSMSRRALLRRARHGPTCGEVKPLLFRLPPVLKTFVTPATNKSCAREAISFGVGNLSTGW